MLPFLERAPVAEKASKSNLRLAIPPRIIKVQELLSNDKLRIPYYQRPYKWTLKNVNQLIDDILLHKKRNAYRLGTLVIHREIDNKRVIDNVVDGQQRTITLTLIALAIRNHKKEELAKLSTKENEQAYQLHLDNFTFKSSLTKTNIRGNYKEIERRIREFDVDAIRFLYQNCELVQVTLEDISEAFQFFDSQNSRGKDLAPYDLLKAFHLREMEGTANDAEKEKSVSQWEAMDSEELTSLFSNYLFKVRNWSKGYPARYFTKDEVGVFKGVSPTIQESFPFVDLYRIGHFYVEGYNKEFHRNIDRSAMQYPFQLDQVIINGKRFFEMVNHYKDLINKIKSMAEAKDLLDSSSRKAIAILDTLQNYEGKDRIGDKYVRNLFDCCLLYYVDKFGTVEISKAIEKFFIWAYTLRLELHAVYLPSIDNHALQSPPIFKIMREALHPADILNILLPTLTENRSTKTEEIEKLFTEMNYYNGR
jgi:hypothetical protein